jgi:hypothetical protein
MSEKNDNDDQISVNDFVGRTTNGRTIEWDETTESILVTWADQAQCYTWLCYTAHLRYSRLQACFSIPTIIFSTIIGATSFTNVSGSFQQYLPIVIGGVNITIGILTTIQQYFKISEYNENFRICSRAWDKFARRIELELTRDPYTRESAGLFLKKASEEFERLMETTPSLPIDIVKSFDRKFKHQKNVHLPRLLYGIKPTEGARNNWFRIEEEKKLYRDNEMIELILNKKNILRELVQQEVTVHEKKLSNKFIQKFDPISNEEDINFIYNNDLEEGKDKILY